MREMTLLMPMMMMAKTARGTWITVLWGFSVVPDIAGIWLNTIKINTGMSRELTEPMGSRMNTLNSIQVSVQSPFGIWCISFLSLLFAHTVSREFQEYVFECGQFCTEVLNVYVLLCDEMDDFGDEWVSLADEFEFFSDFIYG